jgi:hypothetical protein
MLSGTSWHLLRVRDARLALLFEAVALAADVDDGGAVQEPIEGSRGHDRVAGEDLPPVAEGLVAGEHDGLAPLVALGDGLAREAQGLLIAG